MIISLFLSMLFSFLSLSFSLSLLPLISFLLSLSHSFPFRSYYVFYDGIDERKMKEEPKMGKEVIREREKEAQ